MTRIAYLGTPQMSVPPLRALVEHGIDVVTVITRVDKRRGRGSELTPSPVKAAAVELGLPVSHRVDDLVDGTVGPVDLGVVVAFGQIIKPHVLDAVPMVNLHFSLLPRWRGAAPVERAILTGDHVTGVCLMGVEEGLDTGPVYDRVEVPIGPRTTAAELRDELVRAGSEMLVRNLRAGLGAAQPQSGEVTYAAKLTAEDRRLDWASAPVHNDRIVRLGDAWTTFRGKRLKVLDATPIGTVPAPDAAAGLIDGDLVGGLRLRRVQPEGKAPMSWSDFARGARLQPGERLGG